MTQAQAPNGSVRIMNLQRMRSSDPLDWGGQRCEIFYENQLVTGHSFWGSFAAAQKADEPAGSGEMVVMQTHTPAQGDTNPPFALVASDSVMKWNVSYQSNPQVDSKGWLYAAENRTVHSEPGPAPGVIWRYVWHYVPSYLSSPQPLFEVWRAKPGAVYEKLITWTGPNDYNTAASPGVGYTYPRIGPYKWSSWSVPSIAWYLTPIYFGEGADLLEAAKASLAGL